MPLRPRSDAASPRGRSSAGRGSSVGMDLGTRALVLGVGSLVLSWVPLLNIIAFLAALMAVSFGLLARWPTGWLTNQEADQRRGLAGVVLGALGLYEPLVDWAGAGATVPLTGFGYALSPGAKKAVAEQGLLGAFTGGITATAGGIAAAILFGYLFALLARPQTKM